MPYPIFSNHTNITEKNVYEINNFCETEMQVSNSTQPAVLDLSFDEIALFLEGEFEICDLQTGLSFFAKRTGGKHHADIEPLNKTNIEILKEIRGESTTWDRRPVLVKLNENVLVPASLCTYPHGFETLSNGLHGHLCLHFKNSKMDGTKEVDSAHQRCVEKAANQAKNFLESLE